MAAKDLGNAPCLSYAGAWSVRLFRVENLADGADACLSQTGFERREKAARFLPTLWMNLQPCIDKRPDEPCPNSTLMVSRVARAQIAIISGFVVRMTWSKRSQANRRQQPLLYRVEYGLPA